MVFCLFFAVEGLAKLEEYSYKDFNIKTGNIVKMYEKTIVENKLGGVTTTRKIKGKNYIQDEVYVLDEDFATIEWNIQNDRDKTDLKGKREGDTLIIEGIQDRRPVKKSITLDERPLFNHPKVNLTSFVRSGDTSIEFWGLRKSTLKKYLMEAFKEGEETITVDGQPVEVMSVKIVPKDGLLKKYYKRTYYFRSSDGLFVKKKPSKGRSTELILNN